MRTVSAAAIVAGVAVASSEVSSTRPAADTTMPPATRYAGCSLAARRGTTAAAITIIAATGGRPHSPASSGERPATSCRYWDVKKTVPYVTNMPSVVAAIAVENAPPANRRTSTSGFGRRSCRATNATSSATPATTHAVVTGSNPSTATRLTAYTAVTMPPALSTALARSTRPASGLRNSSTYRGATASRSTITGTLGRKTARQSNSSSRPPPSSGPSAAPTAKMPIIAPSAAWRCLSSANIV